MSVSRIRLGRYGTLAAFAALATLAQLEGCGTSAPSSDPSNDPAGANAQPPAKPAFVKLDRSVHPLARPESDIGPLDPNKPLSNLSVVFKLSPAQLADREALKARLLDPGSPDYHKWLTPEEYAARFGASAGDIARTRAWLASQGLDVESTSRLGTRVDFSGRVADVQRAFQTEMHRYQVGGETHFAMTSAPSVPGELSDVVLALHNTHDFFRRPVGAHHLVPITDPQFTNGATKGIAPPDWAGLYDVSPLYSPGIGGKTYDGTGITIAIVGIAEIAQSDVNAFRTKFGLPASTFTFTQVPGTGAPNPSSGGAGVEAVLDVEWAGGIAQGAKINYVATGANDENVDDAVFYAIEQNVAPILSESWGGCELGEGPADSDVLQQYGSAANLLGITYLAASGDQGAAGCIADTPSAAGLYVNLPAALPEVTAVGGTEFPSNTITFGANGYATGYDTSEEVWAESINPKSLAGVGAGGGGISSIFTRPSYQGSVSTCGVVGTLPGGTVAANMRQIPDISAAAASGNNPIFIECTLVASGTSEDCSGTGGTPQIFGIGGTSASTPSFAGVVALLNEATGERLGNINPILYALQSSAPTAFHDITKGNNEIDCKSGTDVGCPTGGKYGFAATTGYDCATGLGSFDALNLVTAWLALTPTTTSLAANPTTTTEGADVGLTATVKVPTPNSSDLTGTVTFTFQTYLADGTTPDLSWVIGAQTIAGGTTADGTASLSVPIPPGLVKSGATFADVVAAYGGDKAHLGSTSAKVRITFGPIGFCVTPESVTIAAKATQAFTALGGVPPIKWYIDSDSTCTLGGADCSSIVETTGVLTAGSGQAGYVIVAAIDNDGAETFANVKVGAPTGAPPWLDAGASTCPVVVDAGTDAGNAIDAGQPTDAGTTADAGKPTDAGTTADAGKPTDAGTTVDAGKPTDAGTTADAGKPTDAGTTVDAGKPTDAGTTADAGKPTDAGTIVDAGHDAGTMADAGKPTDAGGGGTIDAGHPTDSGLATDSGGGVGLLDSGSDEDAGNATDSGSTGDDSGSTGGDSGSVTGDDSGITGDDDAGSISLGDSGGTGTGDDASAEEDAGGTTGGTGNSSGCGCTTAGKTETPTGLLGALVLGVGLVARRRKSRRAL